MVGDGFVQTFDVLIDDLYLSVDIGGCEHLCDFSSYLPVGEWRVDGLHAVGLLGVGVALHLDAPAIGVVDQRVHSALTYQLHCGAECTEFGHARHVDAVAVGVSYLWRRADDNNLAGAQAVEYSEDALPQGGAAHNGVVDHYERVDSIGDASVGDVVDVGREFVAGCSFGYERAQFYILDGYFLDPHLAAHDAADGFGCQCALTLRFEYGLRFQTVEMSV